MQPVMLTEWLPNHKAVHIICDTTWCYLCAWNESAGRSWCGINVLSQRLEHKPVCFMSWPQDVWLWRLISSGLSAPVLILSPHTFPSILPYTHTHTHTHTHTQSLSPKEIHRLFPWHPFTLLPSDGVCAALRLCAASFTHWDNVCISSYSQANPPPIIVNADSLDAGPYVSICSLSLYSICLSHSHSLCVGAWACVCVCVCGWKGCLLVATCCLPCGPTTIIPLTPPVCWECAFCSCHSVFWRRTLLVFLARKTIWSTYLKYFLSGSFLHWRI